MKKKNAFKEAVIRYLAFFSVIGFTVTAAVIIYDMVSTAYNGNREAISYIMLVVCFGLTLFCTTVDFFRRKMTDEKSVEQILEATEMITEGNFNVRLTPRHSYNHYDNLDLIMANLNVMAEELSKNEVLKTDFISNVSHEIKTPLAIIQNYAMALQNEKLSAEERNKYVNTLVQASGRLTDLVMNVLKLNKLENQRIQKEEATVRLDESLTQSIFDFEELIEQKKIELTCDIDEITIHTVPSYLEIVWNNLLSNAIKFTPEGGAVTVSLKNQNGQAVVVVSDTGCGMNEQTGKRIFDKFYQGDTSHAKEGNGLGLALVKKVIEILGGEIAVESELGKGTTFTVKLRGVIAE